MATKKKNTTAKDKKPEKNRFRTKVLTAGKTATGIQIPEEVVEALGKGKRPPVKITINGYTYHSSIAVMGGKFMVGISAEVRAAAHVAGGDEVDVYIEIDTQPREVIVPQDLKKALDQNASARKNFEALSYSNKRRYVLPIEQAKTDETRQRNITKAINELK